MWCSREVAFEVFEIHTCTVEPIQVPRYEVKDYLYLHVVFVLATN